MWIFAHYIGSQFEMRHVLVAFLASGQVDIDMIVPDTSQRESLGAAKAFVANIVENVRVASPTLFWLLFLSAVLSPNSFPG